MGDESKSFSLKALKPGQTLALGFLLLIFVGSVLLTLPAASATGRSIGLLKASFTATSAVCVTGLTLIEAGADLSLFGQIVLLALIQMGGLGFMVFATLAMVLLGRRISLRDRVILGESMNQSGLSGLVRLTLWFTAMALGIELLGAVTLAFRFVPLYGWGKGCWFSLFHSISAFCNAGFDILGLGNSVEAFSRDGLVLIPLGLLIILGGLGFAVMMEFGRAGRKDFHLSLHAKLVLSMTGVLLLFGVVSMLVLEWDNPATLGREGMSFWDKLLGAFFQSVTFRTAGYAALPQGKLEDASKLIGCLLMFVGASPASTGGGIKTTTFAAFVLLVMAVVQGKERVTVFGRELAQETVRRAVALIAIAVGFILLVTCAMAVLERNAGVPFLDLAYEATSAITTTGLSSAGTGGLRQGSQVLLMPLMYFGRVGPLTLAMALARRANADAANRIRHPEEKIMIG